MNIIKWIYRIILVLTLSVLFTKGLIDFFLYCWSLLPEFIQFTLLLSFFVISVTWCIYDYCKYIITKRKQKKKLESEEYPLFRFTEEEESEIINFFLKKYPMGTCADELEYGFKIPFKNELHYIWFSIESDCLLVGMGFGPHHTHFSLQDIDELDFAKKTVIREIDSIISEEYVHMVFYDSRGNEIENDLYDKQEIDIIIQNKFNPIKRKKNPALLLLKIIFICYPSSKNMPTSVEISSYKGTYDKFILKNSSDYNNS